MNEEAEKIFIGVAWPYVNGDPHIGHLAGYLLPADIFARFHRFKGNDVLMASGADCYGTPITVEAEQEDVNPQDLVDKYYPRLLSLFQVAGIDFDIFTKTTTENHKKVAQDFFLTFLKKGYIYKDEVEQYYDSKQERFLPDRYVEGTCPHCGFEEARSDQCDECGRVLSQGEIEDPVSKISGADLEMKKSEHYFFDLPKTQEFLEGYVNQKGPDWRKWVYNETKGWLREGLQPRAFSRDLDWGISLPKEKIPEEDQIKNIESKSFYVWWEAVMGYYSASKEWGKKNNRDWKSFWENEDARHFYFMGKDNLAYHTLFWPAELNIYNPDLKLPDYPAVNQFLQLEGDQFSTSRGVVIDPKEIINKYGLDPVRFYLTTVMPENSDSNFSWHDFQETNNNVLIGTIGNFINRTLKMAEDFESFERGDLKKEVIEKVETFLQEVENNLDETKFRNYSQNLRDIADFGNKYLSKKEPWEKSGEERKVILTNALFITLALLAGFNPLLLEAREKLSKILGVELNKWPDLDFLKIKLAQIDIKNPKPIFEKIEVEKD
ncbi:MAG: methionine--tRNA ligase [Candidatus Magasanikbacteria bacterium]